jgi:toxin FitB
MSYLVDANVLSEPTKPAPSRKVVDWLSANERNLVVDSIILGELCIGILALPRGRKRRQLESWFDALVQTIDCLPWDAMISRRWARLVVDLKEKGEAMPLLDGMIAATALQHDLVIATRNTRDFTRAGVKALNPFE